LRRVSVVIVGQLVELPDERYGDVERALRTEDAVDLP